MFPPRESQEKSRRRNAPLFLLFNQPYHPAPLYPIERVHDVIPVKHRQEAIDRSDSIAGTGRNVLSQDTPGVLNGTNERILVGIIHDAP